MTDQPVDHRAEARANLANAERLANAGVWTTAEDIALAAQTSAMIAIAHALLAGPANKCQSCGVERPAAHDDWCEVAAADRMIADMFPRTPHPPSKNPE